MNKNIKVDKKRIGIVTFHRAINYGAILQVYALQEKLKELNAESIVIDYRNKILEERHKIKSIFDNKSIKGFLKYLLFSKKYNDKYRKFRKFSNEFLKLSEPYFNYEDLKRDSINYDKFICGSDQVWNYKLTNFDSVYFLEFANKFQKNSYAASFGFKNIPSNNKERYTQLLKDFNNMSIRENQGANIINNLLKKDIDVVLDPTLLISNQKWSEIASDNIINEKYILIYAFSGSKYIMEWARKLSEKTGYKIVKINSSLKKEKNITYIKAAGPREYLGLFKNAEYIITNSFHGTAFSINFNKQFFTEFLPESLGVNSRLEDILELFNLRDRQIINNDISISENIIDYIKVNEILDQEREKSIKFLNRIINE